MDAQEYAVTRIEGSPAHRPSWWVNKTRFVHEYQKVGDQWMAVSNSSESDIRIFGQTNVAIEYFAYELQDHSVASETLIPPKHSNSEPNLRGMV